MDNLNITIERKEQLEEQLEFILKKIKNIPIDENKQKEIVIPINDNNNEAIECYNKALEINPQNADAFFNKVKHYLLLKNILKLLNAITKL